MRSRLLAILSVLFNIALMVVSVLPTMGLSGTGLAMVELPMNATGVASPSVALPDAYWSSAYGLACGCPADVDASGEVDAADIGVLLQHFGTTGPGDLDFSGLVDGADLGILLSDFGACPYVCAEYQSVIETFEFGSDGLPSGDASVSIFVNGGGQALGSFLVMFNGLDVVLGDIGPEGVLVIAENVWVWMPSDPVNEIVYVAEQPTTLSALLETFAEDLLLSDNMISWRPESIAMVACAALTSSQAFACNCGAALAESEPEALAPWRKIVNSAVVTRVIVSAAGLGCGGMAECENQPCFAGRVALPCGTLAEACEAGEFAGALATFMAFDALWQDD